jgi:hypothetical protein
LFGIGAVLSNIKRYNKFNIKSNRKLRKKNKGASHMFLGEERCPGHASPSKKVARITLLLGIQQEQ